MSRSSRIGKFDSRFEKSVFDTSLKTRTEHHKDTFKYVTERKYKPDFRLRTRSGKYIYVESKGYWTGAERSKHLAVVAQNPDLDLRLVFMNANNKLNKRSKTTYAGWCDKHGVKWAEKQIPREWYRE